MNWVFAGLLAAAFAMAGLGWLCDRSNAKASADEGIICAFPWLIGWGLLALDGVLAIGWAVIRALFG